MDLLDEVLSERPAFHSGETEIQGPYDPSESQLPQSAKKLESAYQGCYGIDDSVARFIYDSISSESKTLEIGSGLSTLVFALRGSCHVSVTPSDEEVELIGLYAEKKGCDLSTVTFVIDSSDRYLPQAKVGNLDMVLIDGKHAFPWPIVDWFYTADKLRQDGVMIVDDAQMISVRPLVDFMSMDPGWRVIQRFGRKTFAFRKVRQSVHDVA